MAESAEDLQKAIGCLEPLIESSVLSAEDRQKAVSLWARAASPTSIGMAGKGEFQQATALLQRILAYLEKQPEGFHDELLKIQSSGNLAVVRHYVGDKAGTLAAIDQASVSVKKCESLLDENTPFRDVVEFEVMRSTLVKLHSGLMLMDGQAVQAIAMQQRSLDDLTKAVRLRPSNAELHFAYHACCTTLQAVLRENGQVAAARMVVGDWVGLAEEFFHEDQGNPKTGEFLMHAHHSQGHFSESMNELVQAEESCRSPLAVASQLMQSAEASEGLLSQAVELHIHLLKFALQGKAVQTAETHLQQAMQSGLKLKSLPSPNEGSRQAIKQQMENAVRLALEMEGEALRDAWSKRIRDEGLLPNP